jgi:hypothetical protein
MYPYVGGRSGLARRLTQQTEAYYCEDRATDGRANTKTGRIYLLRTLFRPTRPEKGIFFSELNFA